MGILAIDSKKVSVLVIVFEEMERRNNLIEIYYTLRLTFDEIKFILAKRHKVIISTRQLKRITASLGLYRRKSHSNMFDVAVFISKELKESGQLHGYRWMHTKCLERGLDIDKESVRLILKCLDPHGVKCRNARKLTRRTYMNNGPNYIWHMDGYDKLKSYGICIHGCIDGFSRNIMWLEANITNKDPHVIAGYFIDTVRQRTENGTVRELQVALRDCDGHETEAFLYGTSKCNQRIESWWCILRKESAQFWMDMFKTIKEDGHFSGDFLDVNLIRFCFMNLIRDELKIIVRTWNSHKLRSMKNAMTPCGRPELLYNLPELCGAENYLCDVEEAEIDVCEQACTKTSIVCDHNVFDLCMYEMEENNWIEPACASEGIDLYLLLRPIIRNLVL